MNRKSRQSAPPSIAALLPQNLKAMTMMPLTEGEYEDEDDLSEPPADDDILEPPPEEDEPDLPPDDDDDLPDDLSLPSLGSEQAAFFFTDEGEIDAKTDFDGSYGDYLEDLSDPEEDFYDSDEPSDYDYFEDSDLPPPDDEDDLPPPEEDEDDLPPPPEEDADEGYTSRPQPKPHSPGRNRPVSLGKHSSLRGITINEFGEVSAVAVDAKSYLLPESISLPVILPSQRADYEARKNLQRARRGSVMVAGGQGGRRGSVMPVQGGSSGHHSEGGSGGGVGSENSAVGHDTDSASASVGGSSGSGTTAGGSVGSPQKHLDPAHKSDVAATSVATASEVSANADEGHAHMPLHQHPIYARYMKMLKVGIPKNLVAQKMQSDTHHTLHKQVLDCDPALPCPSEFLPAKKEKEEDVDTGEKVPVKEHPTYAKYFKMLQMGVAPPGVQQKLKQDGHDPRIAQLSPDTLIRLGGDGNDRSLLAALAALSSSSASPSTGGRPGLARATSSKRKKKLFVTGIASDSLSSDSLWVSQQDEEEEGDQEGEAETVGEEGAEGTKTRRTSAKRGSIQLDAAEFETLFVEDTASATNAIAQKLAQKQQTDSALSGKAKVITLLSHKRSQNTAIVLARLKKTPEEVLRAIQTLQVEAFASVDQVKALYDCLPTAEEAKLLTSYKGDASQLGAPERYMRCMLTLPDVAQRMCILMYKLSFLGRWQETKHRLGVLESACDQIKSSHKLQQVLKTILKVVNKLAEEDDDAEKNPKTASSSASSKAVHAGITVDSLVKLTTAKAFDRKTSVLQYVALVIHRQAPDVLASLYPHDLSHVPEASVKLSYDVVEIDRASLNDELQGHIQVLDSLIARHDQQHTAAADTAETPDIAFLALQETRAEFGQAYALLCDELLKRSQVVAHKFTQILRYFGENPRLSWAEFMGPLWQFISELIKCRDLVQKAQLQEHRKQQQAQAHAHRRRT